MPIYEYTCDNNECDNFEEIVEVIHSMKDESKHKCETCNTNLRKLISSCANIIVRDGTLSNQREDDHKKKVKDKDRAERMRRKAFGNDAVGTSKPDKYREGEQIDVKGNIRGKALGGQMKEIDKAEFIKAAAKDDYTVKKCQEALKKAENKKKK